jgi:hypothetical protein
MTTLAERATGRASTAVIPHGFADPVNDHDMFTVEPVPGAVAPPPWVRVRLPAVPADAFHFCVWLVERVMVDSTVLTATAPKTRPFALVLETATVGAVVVKLAAYAVPRGLFESTPTTLTAPETTPLLFVPDQVATIGCVPRGGFTRE